MEKEIDEITVDRVSGGRNLIARECSSFHIIPSEVDGRIPQPSEVWQVKEVHHHRHPVALKPLKYIKTIEDYDPLHEGINKEPKRKKNSPRPRSRISSRNGGSSENPFSSSSSSKNSLLTGNKL